MKKLSISKKAKRTLAYVGIIGGCAVLALTFFTISQYEKAKFQASTTVQLSAKAKINKEFYTRTGKVIEKCQSEEEDTRLIDDLGLLNLEKADFANYDKSKQTDLEAALIKLHKPIDAISVKDEYEKRYSLSTYFFGDTLGALVAKGDSEQNWWLEVFEDFTDITNANSAAYIGTAIPAYTFSMATLVAFGLVLKHAEKTKEKEEKEV